ncbi:MAG: hypothetical protein U1D30_08940 [Planctomycetota bacterium]
MLSYRRGVSAFYWNRSDRLMHIRNGKGNMFKKILLALGAVFAVLIVGFVGLLFWAQRAGSQQQEKFFQAVATGDPNAVLELCDPALRDQIDAPVLAAWMAEVHKQLGDYQGLSKANFSTQANATEHGTIVESDGTVHFQRGDATSNLEFRDNLLIKFSINSDKIPPGWFTGPADTTLYRERGEQFIRKFFERDPKGTADMMHEALRRTVPDSKLQSMIDEVAGNAGSLKSIEFQDAKFNADDQQTLFVTYRVDCEKSLLDAIVEFQFEGLKGHLLGFNFKDVKPPGSGD